MLKSLKPLKKYCSQLSFYAPLLGLVLASSFALADGTPAVPSSAPPGTTVQQAAPVAAAGAPAGAQQPPQSMWGMFTPFLFMFAVLYFLMIRPQQKKAKEQQKMLNELKDGDEIVTSSGFLGKVHGIADKVVIVQLADDVNVKVLKSQIAQVVKGSIKELNSN